MYPVLLKIGNLTIHTYGFFVAMGFAIGMTVARHEARRMGENPDKIMDLCFYMLLFAVIASRIFYVFTNWDFFMTDPLEIVKIWNGGLVFYGGFIGGLATLLVYLKKHRMPIWKTFDILAPPLAVGHFLGRIGCFFAGCCYGKVCDLPWAVTFTRSDSLAPTGIPLHPTQLYEAFYNLIIFSFLWWFRTKKTYDGQVFWIYILLYGAARSVIEIFRDDDRGGFVFGIFSVSQIIGLILSVFALCMLFYMPKITMKVFKTQNSQSRQPIEGRDKKGK